MKRMVFLCTTALLGVASLSLAQTAPEPALRPSQVVMRERAAWMKSMNENLAAKKLAEVAKDAGDLSAQAAKVAAGAEGEPKVLHQKVSDLAKAVSEAASKGEEAKVAAGLGTIKETCGECHAKFRPKP